MCPAGLSGAKLAVSYNRTRWSNGRVVVWLSAHRQTGRGEGSSGLAFDLLVNTPTGSWQCGNDPADPAGSMKSRTRHT